jgi:hypothetical protein
MTQIKKIKINKNQCLSVCYNDEKPRDDTDKKDKNPTKISVYQCANILPKCIFARGIVAEPPKRE